MNSLLSLSISFVVLMAGLGLGRLGQRLWLAPPGVGASHATPARRKQGKQPSAMGTAPYADRLLINASLGLGLLSLVILAFGLLHLFGGIGGRVMLVLVLLLAMYGFGDLADRFGRSLTRFKPKDVPVAIWLGVALLVVIAVVTLICGLAPPTGDDWDSLAYHLAIPQLYINHGGISYIDFSSHSNFPFLVEMLYVPGLMLGLAPAAKMMHFWMGVLAVLAVYRLTTRLVTVGGACAAPTKDVSVKAGMLAAVAFAGVPLVMWEATTGYVDLAAGLYTVLAAYAILNYLETSPSPYPLPGGERTHNPLSCPAGEGRVRARAGIVLCGIACGFAASAKMLGLATVGFAAAWLVVDGWMVKRQTALTPSLSQRERGFGSALVVVLIAAAVCAPWYLKTLIYTGNPVYPFYSVFGGKNWNAELAALYSSSQAHFGMGKDIIALLLSPYNLAVHPERFYDTAGLYVGPILLIAAMSMLMFVKIRSRQLLGVAAFILAHVLAWFFLTQQSRYLTPVFALSAALCSGLVYAGGEGLRSVRWGMWTVFVAAACMGLATMWGPLISRLPVVTGADSDRAYLSRTLDIFPAEQYINDELPDNARVILFGDTRGFYLKRDYVWGDWGHNARFSGTFASAQEYVKYLKSQGITHAMVNSKFLPSREEADKTAALVYQAIDRGLFELVYPEFPTSRRVEVYAIR